MNDPGSLPRRHNDDELGRLLHAASREYREGLDEAAAFRRLAARRALEGPPEAWLRRRWPLLAAALLAAALALWVMPQRAARFEEALISADVVPPPAPVSTLETTSEPVPPDAPSAPDAVDEAARDVGETRASAREAAPVPPLDRPEPRPTPRAPDTGEAAARRGTARDTRPPPSTPPAAERDTEPEVDCLELARQGDPRRAERCFSERAASASGLAAEMALYEVARLRADVLRDGAGALDALREHEARCPRGSLRHEVELFELELLARLGRAREALQRSEELLASAHGGERAAELHVLRGNVYRQALDAPALAEREYARAEQLGGAWGAEATYLRASCFEALGRAEAAAEGYRRYLSSDGRSRQKQARARLEELERAARTGAGERRSPKP